MGQLRNDCFAIESNVTRVVLGVAAADLQIATVQQHAAMADHLGFSLATALPNCTLKSARA